MNSATLVHVLRAHDGPLTQELVQRPADFGLGLLPNRLAPVGTTDSVCGFCATGCSLRVHLGADGAAINLSPTHGYPVNLGMACPKGWEALTPLAATDRATTPLMRHAPHGDLAPVSWPQALESFVARMKAVRHRHSGTALAYLSTGQIPTEEMALLGALFKFGIGGLHGDSNTRQCMATAHVAYKQSFGFDAPPYTYADFELGDVLVFIGANPAIAHPIMWQRVMRNPNRPRIVVIDPRRTETAMAATDHVPIAPRGDLWLLYGIAQHLVATGAINRPFIDAHTSGFGSLKRFLDGYPPEACAGPSGVSADEIRRLAGLIARGKAVSFWWTMGVNQGHESTRVAQAIINLALLTGNIGRPGTGANSITGQCNAMGSRLFANATSLLGGRDFTNQAHRAEVAHLLGLPETSIPQENSLPYDGILDAIEAGTVRALWIVATNPTHSWIDPQRLRRIRSQLDLLVVQDMYANTETARMADIFLPAAGWGEKEGTFINSERRIGVTRKVARAPGLALADFAIFKLVAEAWGCGELFKDWSCPEATFQILKRLSRGRPCDITGIRDYAHLAAQGGIQWPWPEARAHEAPVAPGIPDTEPAAERRLFEDGHFFTADARARLLFDPPRPPPERPDASFPFWLNTGRGSSAQWHTGTRTEKSEVLRRLSPGGPLLEIHPGDAANLGIGHGERVIVRSRRGAFDARALLTPTVQPGQVFASMHFEGVNRTTYPCFDPHSRQPSYKACAVSVARAE